MVPSMDEWKMIFYTNRDKKSFLKVSVLPSRITQLSVHIFGGYSDSRDRITWEMIDC